MTNQFDSPYVQQSVDLLKILPQLATGARCAVFTCIGIFDADPLGASKRDILDYTGLSRPTVESAIRFLSLNEWISFDPSTKRYRCTKYYRYGGAGQEVVRELVPILQGERASVTCKKVFSKSHDDDVSTKLDHDFDSKHHHDLARAKEIFSQSGFQGVNLNWLSENVSAETAQLWVDWIATCDRANYRSPHGYAWKMLSVDCNSKPPQIVKKSWLNGFEEFVNK